MANTLTRTRFYWSFLFLAFVCMAFMAAEVVNNRFWLSDFEVYYKAARRILAGENLYQHAEDGHYIFKYSPTSALIFIPFAVFSFATAKYIYWCLLTALIVYGFYLCIKHIKPAALATHDKKTVNRTVFIATFILAVHFLRELHLGQVNYLLVFMYIFAWHCYSKGRWIGFAVLLGLSIFIKPFALVFLPYLLLKQKYRELGVFIASVCVFALLPLLFYGSVDLTLGQYHLWFAELQIELSHKQSLLADANHTVFSVLARYTPIQYLLTSDTAIKIYQLGILALIAFVVYYFVKVLSRKGDGPQQKQDFFIDFALLSALIPLLAFTSENAFIYTTPLVFVVLLHFKQLKVYEKVLAVLGFVCIGGNFAELIGKKLSAMADQISLISVGTVILICLLFIIRKRGLANDEAESAVVHHGIAKI